MRICADCGRRMKQRRSCRHCFGTRSMVVDREELEDDYGDESDADSVYRESSLLDAEVSRPAQ